MELFQLGLGLLGGGALLALLARRLMVPYPALLALAGAALAFVPGLPQLRLDPELALALFVAPVLLDAAYDASPRDLRDNWLPVGGLVFVAVGTTILAVALVARWLVSGMPWAAAVALGAIVAPPDASAATAVLRQLHLPHRVMVILEGESLLNDATSLLALRGAVAVAAGSFHAWPDLPLLLLSCAGGVAAGWALARLYMAATRPIRDTGVSVALQFVGTFAVWILADRSGLSAIITMVAYAVTLARQAPYRTDARHRVQSYAVWEVAVLVLNILAFVVIGMQLRAALPRLAGPEGETWLLVAGAVLLACVLARIAWVMAYNTVIRWKNRRFGVRTPRPMIPPTVGGGLLISWCGMRGIVTLAAALSLPEGFPQRELIGFAAFAVVLGTLVLQGMTLRPLMARLELPVDRSVEQEVALARQEIARAALAELQDAPPSKARNALRQEYEQRLSASLRPDAGEAETLGNLAALQSRIVAAERRVVARLVREGRIGDDAYHVVEAELDRAEIAASA